MGKKIAVGDKLPDGELYECSPENVVKMHELCAGKKVVIFGVPGAFTPVCSAAHLPGYINHYKKLQQQGIKEIICLAVNDPYVMEAWSEDQKVDGKIRLLADPMATYARAIGLETYVPSLASIRYKRFSMIADNLVVVALNLEPDGAGITCSRADRLKPPPLFR